MGVLVGKRPDLNDLPGGEEKGDGIREQAVHGASPPQAVPARRENSQTSSASCTFDSGSSVFSGRARWECSKNVSTRTRYWWWSLRCTKMENTEVPFIFICSWITFGIRKSGTDGARDLALAGSGRAGMRYLPDVVATDLKKLPPAFRESDPEFEPHGFFRAAGFHQRDLGPVAPPGLLRCQGQRGRAPEPDSDHRPALKQAGNIAEGFREPHRPCGKGMDGKGLEDQERLDFEQAAACTDHAAPRLRAGGGRALLSPVPAQFFLPSCFCTRAFSCCFPKCRDLPAVFRLPVEERINDFLMRDSSLQVFVKYSKDVQKGRNAGHGGTSTTPEKKRPHRLGDDGVTAFAGLWRS